MAECSHTLHRELARFEAAQAVRDDFLLMTITVDPSMLAREVVLSRHAVLGRGNDFPAGDGRAFRAGSRLLRDRDTRVLIEGQGGRFPTEAVPFSAAGREDAPWDVALHYVDLHDSFLGAVRLLVNTEHPAGAAALSPEHPEHRLVVSVMRWDVVRRLLFQVAMSSLEEEALHETWDTEALGGALDGLCDLYIKRPLADVVADLRRDGSSLEASLQARMQLLQGVK
jgi:hypothetical protein